MLAPARTKFLRDMGVHDDFLGHPDYAMAQVRAVLEEADKVHKVLVGKIRDLFLDASLEPTPSGQVGQKNKTMCLTI